MKTILVTGANGYVGSHVVNLLINDRNVKVVAVDFNSSNLNDKNVFLSYDILKNAQSPTLYQDLLEPDICLHLAWKDGFNHSAESHIDFLPAHYHFLKNLIEHGCKQISVAGSFREYGNFNGKVSESAPAFADNNYSLAKLALKRLIEISIKDKDICFQWLRFFTPYGDDEKNNSILSKILRWEREGKKTFPFTDGSEQYDYIHIDEMSKQIIAVIEQTDIDGVINCCSGNPTSLKEITERFLKQNDLKIKPEYGVFPHRNYDSNIIYGDNQKINTIMNKKK